MSRSLQRRSISRRSLLKGAALSSGAVMVPGFLRASSSPVKLSADAGRIGLLLPEGDQFASINDRLERELAGQIGAWKRRSGERGEVLRLRCGGSPTSIRRALENLFHDQGADRILCYQSSLAAPTISEVATALRRPVYLLNSGAHPLDPSAMSDWLHVSTLDLFGQNRDLAGAAAGRGLRRGVVLSSTAEAGFGTAEAIRAGFEGGGGVVERYLIADSPGFASIDRTRLRSVIEETRADVIFLLLHPERDRERASHLSSLAGGIPGVSVARNGTISAADVIRLAAGTIGKMLDPGADTERRVEGDVGSRFSTSSACASGGVPVPYV